MFRNELSTFEKFGKNVTCSNEFLSIFNDYTLDISGIFFNPYKTQHQKIAWGLICGFLKSWETDKLTKKIFK